MSDLEATCRELIDVWRNCEDMTWEYQQGLAAAANDLEKLLDGTLECSVCGGPMTNGRVNVWSKKLYCSNECLKQANIGGGGDSAGQSPE